MIGGDCVKVSQIVERVEEGQQDQQVGQALTRLGCNVKPVLRVQKFSWSLTDDFYLTATKVHFESKVLHLFSGKNNLYYLVFIIN